MGILKNKYEDSHAANPLDNAICQRDKLMTNIEIFLGCTVGTFKTRSDESVTAIRGYADHIDEVANKCNRTEYHTCITKGMCGAVTIGSLLLAPTTGGTSLFIATGASVVGAIAVCVGRNASSANLRCEQDFGEKAKVASERVISIIKTFHKLLTEYDDVLIKAKNYLKTSEGILLFTVLKTNSEPRELTFRSFVAKAIKNLGSKTKLMEYITYIGQYGIASTTTMASSLFLSHAVNEGGLGIWRLFDQTPTKQNSSLVAVKLREYAKSIEDSTEALLTQYVKCTEVNDGKSSARQAQTDVTTGKVNHTHQNKIEECTKMQTSEMPWPVQPEIAFHFHGGLKKRTVSTSRGNTSMMVNLDKRDTMKLGLKASDQGRAKLVAPSNRPNRPDTDKLKMTSDSWMDRCTNRNNFQNVSMTVTAGKREMKIWAKAYGPDVLKVTAFPTKLKQFDPVKLKMPIDPYNGSGTHQNNVKEYAVGVNVGGRQMKLEAKCSGSDTLEATVTPAELSYNNLLTYTMTVYFDLKDVRASKGHYEGLNEVSAIAELSHTDLIYSEKYTMEVDFVQRKMAVRATMFDLDKLKAVSVTTVDRRLHQNISTTKAQVSSSNRSRNPTSDHVAKAHHWAVIHHCVFCGEDNHIEDQCWHGRQVKCHRCQSLGHKSKFCPF